MSIQDQASDTFHKGRRGFIKTTGYLVLGFNLIPMASCVQNNHAETQNLSKSKLAPASSDQVNAWLKITDDGWVTVMTGKMELGQGIKTALQQIAAEELDVSMEKMRIIIADTGETQDERYTAGSGSIEGSGAAIRNAAASARALLLDMAAKKLSANKEKLLVSEGLITDLDSGESISYATLVKEQSLAHEILPSDVKKSPDTYRLVGQPIPRQDIKNLAIGERHFIHDLRLPEMVHARILRPPLYHATLKSLPEDDVSNISGVLQLIRDGDFVAVIAEEEFSAIQALQLMQKVSVWEKSSLSMDEKSIYKSMMQSDLKEEVVDGDKNLTWKDENEGQLLEAKYFRPYHMHGSIGPSCAVALWKEDFLTIWSPTQGVYPLRRTISDLLGISEEKIRAIGVPGSGCYGHNGADDVSADAALLATKFPGRPVRVQWMREDEHKWEPFGSAMAFHLKAQLNAKGKIERWQTKLWSDTHSTRPNGKAGHFIAARHLEKPHTFDAGGYSGGSYRNASPYYSFGSKKIISIPFKGPLRTSALRSLGAYANIFALESFMDELALLAGKDVVEFRLDHLEDDRAKEVIKSVVQQSGFQLKKPNIGKGIAFSRYKNTASYFAVVAEVEVIPAQRTFNLKKLTGTIDAGQVINPDGLKNQTEGGMIQAASWTMKEAVKFEKEGIISDNWERYPIYRFLDVPEIEVIVLDRPRDKSLGAGEAAQGPVAAAIANAIFDATGDRIRELPLTADKINWT